MATTQTVLQGKDTASQGELYMSLDLGDRSWKVTIGDGRRGPSRYSVDAGDTAAVLDCLAKARSRSGHSTELTLHSCYEAGRDGWWLHRWLISQGIDNIVVDSASIEVNRRARRAKPDRIDGDKLLAMLLRHHVGERVWSVLHEPTPADEDARRTHRELTGWCTSARHTPIASARCSCCTTCVRASSSAVETGQAGGTSTACKYPRSCAPSASARARGWPWNGRSAPLISWNSPSVVSNFPPLPLPSAPDTTTAVGSARRAAERRRPLRPASVAGARSPAVRSPPSRRQTGRLAACSAKRPHRTAGPPSWTKRTGSVRALNRFSAG